MVPALQALWATPIRMVLSEEPEAGGRTEASQVMLLEITNVGKEAITLDARLLNPVLLAEVRGPEGNILPNMPPSVPRDVQASDMVILKPSGTREMRFTLGSVNIVDLEKGPVTVSCEYDSTETSYPKHLQSWSGKARSNALELTRPRDKEQPTE